MQNPAAKNHRRVSVIGLGYVGLPVAVAFGEVRQTIGYDVDTTRIAELKQGVDRTKEIDSTELQQADVNFTSDVEDLKQADFHIVAVPTPIDSANRPDLTLLLKASEDVGGALKTGDIVVYESTVYPGVTEEICAPVLESVSGLKCGSDFKVGYSPERINPGIKEHSFSQIKKVVSGQDEEAREIIATVYESVVKAGVFRAASIKVTEAAKVIENTQRDLNIALMNELTLIFDRLDIDTTAVLEAASTKWNFVNFKPGLVGGHCIGVDPYYLTHKAEEVGYIPQVILAGRRINDSMGRFIAQRAMKEMIRAGHDLRGSNVTVLGLSFKENCADLRNSKVVDIVSELKEFGISVQVHDPLVDQAQAFSKCGIELVPADQLAPASMLIVAVAHQQFRDHTIEDLKQYMGEQPVLIDIQAIYDPDAAAAAGIRMWRP